MAKETKTRPVTMIQVREYLAKAEEFLLAARSELEAECSIAATSLAIHAGINAADAVCGARLQRRAAGQDHRETIRLLGQAGDDGPQLAKDSQRLLPLKTKTEYEPEATSAIEWAKRCIEVARRVIGSLRSPVRRTPRGFPAERPVRPLKRQVSTRKSTDRRRACRPT